jgi:hypothetical protein
MHIYLTQEMPAMMRTCILLLATILVYAAAIEASPCPWRTVAHVDAPTVQSFGKWAVDQLQAHLRFDGVKSAKAQAVGDCTNNINRNYELIIDASPRVGLGDDRYTAVVYVEGWTHPKKLISMVRG